MGLDKMRDASISAERDPTLHQRILGDIESRILSGEWAPGFRIPFEVELAADYGCSRMTVNKVLTQLARAGLVGRKKRSGTFVLQPRAQSAVMEIHDIETEVQSLKQIYSFGIMRRRTRKVGINEVIGLDDVGPGSKVLEIACLHRAGGIPFCLEERLINLASVPEAAAVDFGSTPPGKWLLTKVPWSNAEHRIQAVAASRSVADALHVPVQTACLVVERQTWSGSGSVTHVRLTYPGDRHALIATFTPTA